MLFFASSHRKVKIMSQTHYAEREMYADDMYKQQQQQQQQNAALGRGSCRLGKFRIRFME